MNRPGVALPVLLSGFGAVLALAQHPPPPPPGRLIDVGGHRVHLYCTGQGSPAVIVVGGLSVDWYLVQTAIARLTTICTYDVSGTAWSDPGPVSTCPDRAAEIQVLLRHAGVHPPFVFVGHSVGGLVARYYAGRYPQEVAGMVLVDHAFTPAKEPPLPGPPPPPPAAGNSPPVLLETTPIVLTVEETSNFNRLPPRIRELHRWAAARRPVPDHALAADDCESRMPSAAFGARSLGGMPLVVVSTANQALGYAALQSQLLALSINSAQMRANRSFHSVEIDQPEVVVQAIRKVVGELRMAAPKNKQR